LSGKYSFATVSLYPNGLMLLGELRTVLSYIVYSGCSRTYCGVRCNQRDDENYDNWWNSMYL